MDKINLTHQADQLKSDLDKLDLLIDNMTDSQVQALSKVYESVSIILKAQQVLVKPGLRLIRD